MPDRKRVRSPRWGYAEDGISKAVLDDGAEVRPGHLEAVSEGSAQNNDQLVILKVGRSAFALGRIKPNQ